MGAGLEDRRGTVPGGEDSAVHRGVTGPRGAGRGAASGACRRRDPASGGVFRGSQPEIRGQEQRPGAEAGSRGRAGLVLGSRTRGSQKHLFGKF